MEKETILIVDDIMINREMLKFIFHERFQLLEAEDGNQAIDLLEENQERLELIFLDLIMPKKNGLEVLGYMKERGYMECIPVIVITGEATADAEERAYEYGASDIIYKPFEPKVVMRRARNVIELFQHKRYLRQELPRQRKKLEERAEGMKRSNELLRKALDILAEREVFPEEVLECVRLAEAEFCKEKENGELRSL